jgi:flavin-dependent dehydrogenase
MAEKTRILGAGPAGLCAAINIARSGRDAKVYERTKSVGMRFHPNLQGLRYVNGDPEGFLKSVGLKSRPNFRHFKKAFILTRHREIELDISLGNQMPFVVRGGRNSLEVALFQEAERVGVEFEFCSKKSEAGADIVASGGRKFTSAAVGSVFEDTDFPRDHYAVMYDDRYSPRGWYSYIVPFSNDLVEFVTCVSAPHAPRLAALHAKAMNERRFVRDCLSGKKKVGSFGGGGDVRLPKTAFVNGKYYVGEAAGFQDPFMGFGIVYALKSGKFASDAVVNGLDYDAAWKREILPLMKKDFARRLPVSILGDIVPELVMLQYKNGQKVDFGKAVPDDSPLYRPIQEAFFRLEVAKKGILGGW